MNDLIRTVLDLPAGSPWPPGHLALLGFESASVSPSQIESAVMERMARLRNYQLAQPDEVTEAMNQLARALVELTNPPAAIAPIQLPNESPPVIELAPESEAVITPVEVDFPEPVAGPALELLPESFEATIEQRATRLPLQELRKAEPTLLEESTSRPRRVRRHEAAQPDVSLPYPTAPWSARKSRSPRRASIRTLVRYRQLLRAWDVAGTYLAQPEIVAMSRAESIAVLIALGEIERADWTLNENRDGGLVLNLARSRPNISALWDAPYHSREAMRNDWHAGRHRLLSEYQHRRNLHRHRTPMRTFRRLWQKVKLTGFELTVAAAGLTATGIALWRLKT